MFKTRGVLVIKYFSWFQQKTEYLQLQLREQTMSSTEGQWGRAITASIVK